MAEYFAVKDRRTPSYHSMTYSGEGRKATLGTVVPANGWFEWQGARGAKLPWYITLADNSPISLAAPWERWDKTGDPVETFTIITTEVCDSLKDIHHRQPAIAHPDHFAAWLDPASRSEQLLDVVRKPCAGPFEKRPVSTQ